MKKLSIFLSMLIASVLYVANVNAQAMVSYNNADFADETNPWIADLSFDFAEGGVTYNVFNNANKHIKVLIDCYEEAMGDVKITFQLLKVSGDWSVMDIYAIYSSDEGAEAIYPAIPASEFTDGQGIIEFDLPAGIAPAESYDEYAAGDCWMLQVATTTPTANGITYSNFKVVIEEEITGTASINKLEALDVAVYPNPVNKGGKVYFDASEFSNEVSIDIYNLAGQLVSSQVSSASELISVDADFTTGIYTMQISDGDKCSTQKFVIK